MEEHPNVSRKRRPFNTELIVALSAIFISSITVFVYIYQARIMQQQQHASVWPYVEWDMTISSENGFYISVINKGVGPALIRSTALKLDGESVPDATEYLKKLLGDVDSLSISWNFVDNRVIAAGETIELFHVYTDVRTKLSEAYARTSFEICFCSIYDDCWVSKGLNVEESVCD